MSERTLFRGKSRPSWCPFRAQRLSLCLTVLLFSTVFPAIAAPAETSNNTITRHAILIGGINRDPQQNRDKDQAIVRLQRFFATDGGVVPENLHVFTAPDSLAAHLGKSSTRDELSAAFSALATQVQPQDQVTLYFVGQANIVQEKLRFNLPGPDLTHEELAEALAPIHPAEFVIILDCPGAGLATKSLSAPDRIIVSAARSDQPHSTRFSGYFVPALGNPEGDFDGDGRTSLLESFQFAAQEIDALYRDQELMKNETPLLEDDYDAEPSQSPWRFATTGKDGARAAVCFLEATVPPIKTDEKDKIAEENTNQGGDDHETTQ